VRVVVRAYRSRDTFTRATLSLVLAMRPGFVSQARRPLSAFALCGLLACSSAAAGSTCDAGAALEDSIRAHRVRAEYAEAARIARELERLRLRDPGAKPYQLEDARWYARTLGFIATLPDSAQAELAWTDRAFAESAELYRKGAYDEALAMARRRLSLRRKYFEPEHPFVAECLDHLGLACYELGLLDEAEHHLREALAVSLGAFSPEHPEVAFREEHLGRVLRDEYQFAEAESLLCESTRSLSISLGPEDEGLAVSLDDLACLLMLTGCHAEADAFCRRGLEIRRRVFGSHSLQVAWSLRTLGMLLYQKRDYSGAETALRETLAIVEEALGPTHTWVALNLSELANVYALRGDCQAAVPLLRRAIAIDSTLTQGRDRKMDQVEGRLASVLHHLGQDAEAERLLRRVIASQLEWEPDRNVDAAASMWQLADVLVSAGKPAEAGELFSHALQILNGTLPGGHQLMIQCLVGLASCYRLAGEYQPAELLLMAAASRYEQCRARLALGVERMSAAPSMYALLADTQLRLGHPLEAWQAAERVQARVLDDLLASMEHPLLSSAESARSDSLTRGIAQLEDQLVALGEEASEAPGATGNGRTEDLHNRLLRAQAELSALRLELTQRDQRTSRAPCSLDQVQAAIDEETAIIGWLDIRDGGSEHSAWGYVIRNRGPVRWSHLSPRQPGKGRGVAVRQWVTGLWKRTHGQPAGRVATPVQAFRRDIVQRPVEPWPARRHPSGIWEERFAPLMPHLEGVRHLVVVPSGQVYGVPVEAVPIPRSGEALGDRFAISYAPSASVYARLTNRPETAALTARPLAITSQTRPCLAVGDPVFTPREYEDAASPEDLVPDGYAADSSSPFCTDASATSGLVPAEEDVLRSGALSGSRDALSRLRRLPVSGIEARAVVARHPAGGTLLIGPDASEQELRRMAAAGELGRYGTIHIATHTLFDDEHPDRSAFVLSQVNLPDPYDDALNGRPIIDGLVTGGEVAREWKLDAELVTLSACETGLGQPVAGEGYVGLVQAFLEAGARSLLVSLWKVDDRATALLMQRFYENWRGQYFDVRFRDRPAGVAVSKSEALREAKRWLKSRRDRTGRQPYAHPFFWAGFVIMGNPD
jgi:CHAT domain-containing protein/tetratricopeptide (TPR) repeat protein